MTAAPPRHAAPPTPRRPRDPWHDTAWLIAATAIAILGLIVTLTWGGS